MSKNTLSDLNLGSRYASGQGEGAAISVQQHPEYDRYQRLAEAVVDGLIICDCDHRVLYANSKFCQSLGYTMDQLQNIPVGDLLDDASKPLLLNQIDNILAPDSLEVQLNWRGENSGNVESWVSPLPIETFRRRDVVFFVVSFSTDQDNDQQPPKSVSESGRVTMNGVQASFIEQDGKIIASNGSVAEIIGAETDDQATEKLLLICNWESIESRQLYRFRRNNGTVSWVEFSFSQIDYNGKAARLGSIVDMTSFWYLENRVRHAQSKQANLLDKLDKSHETERKRISNDLHDGVGSYLTALKLNIERMLDKPVNNDCLQERLEGLVPIIGSAIEQMRGCIMALRPPLLDDLGLLATLRNLASEFEVMYGSIRVECQFNIDESSLSDQLSTIIYRLVQESLNNIAKHAKANQAVIVLEKHDKNLRLSINDNGVGFSLKEFYGRAENSKSIGLFAMQERIELSGGDFSISSEPAVGTTVSAIWRNIENVTGLYTVDP